jgi:hypothetical protein
MDADPNGVLPQNRSPHVIELVVTVVVTSGRGGPAQPIVPNPSKTSRSNLSDPFPDENTMRLAPRAREEHGLTKDPATISDKMMSVRKGVVVSNFRLDGTTYSSIWAQDEPLTLEHAAAVSPDGAKFKYVGRWFSKSYYLGTSANGDYYVKHLGRSTPSPNQDVLTDWGMYNFVSSHRFDNPVGFFFDDDKAKPFLLLAGFNATSFSISSQGIGLLLRSYSKVQAAMQEVAWQVQGFINPTGTSTPEAPAR